MFPSRECGAPQYYTSLLSLSRARDTAVTNRFNPTRQQFLSEIPGEIIISLSNICLSKAVSLKIDSFLLAKKSALFPLHHHQGRDLQPRERERERSPESQLATHFQVVKSGGSVLRSDLNKQTNTHHGRRELKCWLLKWEMSERRSGWHRAVTHTTTLLMVQTPSDTHLYYWSEMIIILHVQMIHKLKTYVAKRKRGRRIQAVTNCTNRDTLASFHL